MKATLLALLGHLFYADPTETQPMPRRLARALVWLLVFTSPFLYDRAVPEVAGDIKWYVLHSGVPLVLAIIAYMWSQQAIKKGVKLAAAAPIWLLGALVLWNVFSLVDAVHVARGVWFLKHFAAYCGLAAAIYWLRHPAFLAAIVWALLLPIIPISLLGIIQFLMITTADLPTFLQWINLDWLHQHYRMSAPPAATFANKNLSGSYLAMMVPLCLWFLWHNGAASSSAFWQKVGGWQKWILATSFALGSVFLLYTRSRASWVALLVALMFFAVWVAVHPAARACVKGVFAQRNWLPNTVAIGYVVAIIALMAPLETGTKNPNVSHEIGKQFSTITTDPMTNFGPRIAYNMNNLVMLRDHWLNGVGVGNFHKHYPLYHDAVMPTPPRGYNVSARPQRAHNDLMQAFVELGLIGGFMYLAIFAFALVAAWGSTRALASQPNARAAHIMLPSVLLAGCVGMATNSMMDFPFQMPVGPTVLFTGFGVLFGLATVTGAMPLRGLPKIGVLQVPKVALLGLMGISLVASGWFVVQSWDRREAAKDLKIAMSLAMRNIVDDRSLTLINRSMERYPHNDRTQEYQAIIYSHYKGKQNVPLEKRLDIISKFRAKDPFVPTGLVNESKLLLEKHTFAQQTRNAAQMRELLGQVKENLAILQRTAPFSHHTWVLTGVVAHRELRFDDALVALQKALNIKPNDRHTQQVVQTIQLQKKLREGRGG